MLTAYTITNGQLKQVSIKQLAELSQDLVWLDLYNPSEEERRWIAEAYDQQLQFMEELSEIEASARFYRDALLLKRDHQNVRLP
jgi:magnesium transporter